MTELTYGLEVKGVITFRVGSDWEGKMNFSGPASVFLLKLVTCYLCVLILWKFVTLYIQNSCTFLHVYIYKKENYNVEMAWTFFNK